MLARVAITVQLAHAQITLNLTRAGGDKPYGGEKLGTVLIVPKKHLVSVTANMSAPPARERYMKVGLSMTEAQGNKLSLGEFSKNGTLTYEEQMVNPIHCNRRTI